MQWSHIGHIISRNMYDLYDIMHYHDSLVKQINNILCFWVKLDRITKLRLLVSYCYSQFVWFFGILAMDMLNMCTRHEELVFVMSGGLQFNAHNSLLPLLCCRLPL